MNYLIYIEFQGKYTASLKLTLFISRPPEQLGAFGL